MSNLFYFCKSCIICAYIKLKSNNMIYHLNIINWVNNSIIRKYKLLAFILNKFEVN